MESTASPRPLPVARLHALATRQIDRLQPLFALAIRIHVARVFFASGLIKLENWAGTQALFENEFHVPVLTPYAAALLGTAAELGLPAMLVLGLGTRAVALALFAFNVVAVISYPDLSDAGFKDHVLWGALLTVTFIYGPGRFALDAWLANPHAA